MKQKIIVAVRTLNEENRIGQFCSAYEQADMILIADGGSEDNTLLLADAFPNVKIIHYNEKVQLANGYWRNPDSDHVNFLLAHAYSLQPDWIIFDDCDIRPNYLLRQDYIRILNSIKYDVVLAVRVYLWGKDKYFPLLSSPLGEPSGQGSLWAWRGNLDLWTVDAFPHFTLRIGDTPVTELRTDAKTFELLYPYCLLHYNWQTPEMADAKVKYHRESGITPEMRHPLDFGGNLRNLEEWMYE